MQKHFNYIRSTMATNKNEQYILKQINMKTLIKKISSVHWFMILSAMAFCTHCFGQDTIIMRNGQSVFGHVIEVSTVAVKYKKIELVDGPIYIEDKSSVDRIHYKNGFKDVFPEIKPWLLPVAKVEKTEAIPEFKQKTILERRGGRYMYGKEKLSEKELYTLVLSVNDPEINRQVQLAKKSKGLQYIGFATIPVGAAAMLAMLVSQTFHTGDHAQRERTNERTFSNVLFSCAAITCGSSIYFKINRKYKNAEAVRLYKQKFD